MRYKNPEKWGRKTLQTFMDSELKQDIDKKYPNAVASYKVKTKKVSGFFERKDYCHRMDFNLQLDQGKNWNYHNTTLNTPQLLDDMFSKKLGQTSLKMIEDDIAKEAQQQSKHESYIKKAEKENKLHKLSFWQKLFK